MPSKKQQVKKAPKKNKQSKRGALKNKREFTFEKVDLKKLSKEEKKIDQEFQGVVTSDKMDKTIVAQVSSVKVHSKYNKRFRLDKKYKVHDPNNKYKIGDIVKFVPTKPISRDKKWIVIDRDDGKN